MQEDSLLFVGYAHLHSIQPPASIQYPLNLDWFSLFCVEQHFMEQQLHSCKLANYYMWSLC